MDEWLNEWMTMLIQFGEGGVPVCGGTSITIIIWNCAVLERGMAVYKRLKPDNDTQ